MWIQSTYHQRIATSLLQLRRNRFPKQKAPRTCGGELLRRLVCTYSTNLYNAVSSTHRLFFRSSLDHQVRPFFYTGRSFLSTVQTRDDSDEENHDENNNKVANNNTTRGGDGNNDDNRVVIKLFSSFERRKKYPQRNGSRTDRVTATKDTPVKITPVLRMYPSWYSKKTANNGTFSFKLEEFVDENSFKEFVAIMKKSNFISFESTFRGGNRWEIEIGHLDEDYIQHLRNELQKKHYILGRFPCFERVLNEDTTVPAEQLLMAERVSWGMEQATVVILRSDKPFLIVCPDDHSIQSLITDELTGVTDTISEGKFPEHPRGCGIGETFVTYDVWLVAELIDLLKERLPNISIVICEDTKEKLESRYELQQSRQRPIEEVVSNLKDGHALYPYQNEGVRFLQDNDGKGILAFEMGLGKTATTLAYIAAEKKRAVVVCPKNVRSVWIDEAVEMFSSYHEGNVSKLGTTKLSDSDINHLLSRSRLVTVNHEILEKYLEFILKANFDCLVLDESHLLKDKKAKRTKRILKIKDSFPQRILLTGTPIKNRESELSSQLEIVGVDVDVTDMTPGAVWNMLHARNIYMKKTLKEELTHLQLGEAELIDTEIFDDGMEDFHDWEGESILQQVQRKLMEVAILKLPKTCQVAMAKIQEDPNAKAIIFTERKRVMGEIFSILSKKDDEVVLMHHGGLTNRDEIIKDFQSDPSKRILVSTRQSLAVGVSLQCANIVIFNDVPWSPADIQQAVGRIRRLNQKKPVFEYWMKSNTQFDENLLNILMKKMKIIKQYAEGQNLKLDQLAYGYKKIDAYEIAGIERPKKSKKKKRH